MSSRLASFRGPSTPTTSPALRQQQPNSPSSPSRYTESTYHRKTRTLLQELRSVTETWDDLVLIDGLKAARQLVDTRTDLDNALKLVPDRRPNTHLVGPKLIIMDECIARLDAVLAKLQKQFQRMNSIIENLELVLIDAHKVKGWQWVQETPLWVTWPLEAFVTRVPEILKPYHRSLALHTQLVDSLRKHSTPFEVSREIVNKWVEQPWLEGAGWEAVWEDICEAEVERWGGA
ncbi:hypothetical protein JR316_0003647 [Psilocybe cubensis]|uniref:Uncharacterized protein n=2 Tax=Psilocybe cubensis TaxID=181762 RepID=A0A8H7Y5L5_PSICU|nr:hypothetical protein JR316_0003647 [Psilocybe cubensis]KAH9484167.1 hypothetical protein JR316_0003647 [Psilocybe cubensis]